jgi:hypothetical protein
MIYSFVKINNLDNSFEWDIFILLFFFLFRVFLLLHMYCCSLGPDAGRTTCILGKLIQYFIKIKYNKIIK